MTVRARLDVGLPALRETLVATRGRCVVEQIVRHDAETVRCALRGPEPVAARLPDDPTVGEVVEMGTDDEEHLVQVTVAAADVGYDAWVDTAGILDTAVATVDGWRLTLRFPGEGALQDCYDALCDGGFRVRMAALRTADASPERVVSPAQRELLEAAYRRGYFDVPRDTTLRELAALLDVSPQAASERLRRGLAGVIEQWIDRSAPSAEDHPRPHSTTTMAGSDRG